MRAYISFATAIAAFVLLTFLLVEAFQIPLLSAESAPVNDASVVGALVGVGLLLVDVFVPVPSSVVMIANGAMFGVLGGTLLTLAGAVGGAMIGFLVGHQGARLIHRFVSPAEQDRARRLIARWGLLAIIVTRPLPILAETVAIMAGATSFGWRRMLAGSVIGVFPVALIYALTGAITTDFDSGVLVFGAVLLLAAIAWVVGRRLEHRVAHATTDPTHPPA